MPDGVRQQRRHQTHEDQTDAGFLKTGDEAGAGAQTDDADEDAQADSIEDPDRRLGDSSEERIGRPQPAEHEPHDQRAAARSKRQRDAGNGDREQADETTEHDPGADEHHVGRRGGSIGISDLLGGVLDLCLCPDETEHVSPVDARHLGDGNLLPRSHDVAQKHPARALEPCQIHERVPYQRAVRDDDIERFDRDATSSPVAAATGPPCDSARRRGCRPRCDR